MGTIRAIDFHQHLWPEPFVRALLARRQPPRLVRSGGELRLVVAHEPESRVDLQAHDPDVRLERLERDGVGAAVISISSPIGVEALPGEEALALVQRRSAADAILHRRVAARHCGGEPGARRLADAAFAEQLVRYGALTSKATLELDLERRAAAGVRATLEARSAELERAREMLDVVWSSRSWRLTSPLRLAGQALRDRVRRRGRAG